MEKKGEMMMNKRLLVVKKESSHKKENGQWYFNFYCYETDTVKWILSQKEGASIFIFYQRLFALTVVMEKEGLAFHEISKVFREAGLFSDSFIEYAISILAKAKLVEEIWEKVNGTEIMWVYLPDNDILRRKI